MAERMVQLYKYKMKEHQKERQRIAAAALRRLQEHFKEVQDQNDFIRITSGFAVHKRILKVLGGLALCLLVIWFLKDYVVRFGDEDKLELHESTANDQGAPTTSGESRTCGNEHRTSNKEDGNKGRASEEGDNGRASGKGGTVDKGVTDDGGRTSEDSEEGDEGRTVDEGVTDDEGRTSEDGRTSSDTDENDECKIVTNSKGEETANNVLLE